MNKWRWSKVILALLAVPFLGGAANAAEQIKIESWIETIHVVSSDSSLDVVDSISVSGNANSINNFVRRFPTSFANEEGQHFKIEVEVKDVSDAGGRPIHYLTSRSNDQISLSFDQARSSLPAGSINHLTYKIHYILKGAVKPMRMGQQVCWQVVGEDLNSPIDVAESLVYLPENTELVKVEMASFIGPNWMQYGEAYKAADGIAFRAVNLKPHQSYIIDIRSPIVMTVSAPIWLGAVGAITVFCATIASYWPIWFIPLFVATGLYLSWWRLRDGTAAESSRPASSLRDFEIPRPADIRMLDRTVCDSRSALATIIDLANRGFVTGLAGSDHFEFRLVEKNVANLNEYETMLLGVAFAGSEAASAKDIHSRIERVGERLRVALHHHLENVALLPAVNTSTKARFYALAAVFAFCTVAFYISGRTDFAIGCFTSALILAISALGRSNETLAGVRAMARARTLTAYELEQSRPDFLQEADNSSKSVGDTESSLHLLMRSLASAIALDRESEWLVQFEISEAGAPQWMELNSTQSACESVRSLLLAFGDVSP